MYLYLHLCLYLYSIFYIYIYIYIYIYVYICRTQRPLYLRSGSAAPRLLGLRVRIPPVHGCWSVVSGVCCQVEVSASG